MPLSEAARRRRHDVAQTIPRTDASKDAHDYLMLGFLQKHGNEGGALAPQPDKREGLAHISMAIAPLLIFQDLALKVLIK